MPITGNPHPASPVSTGLIKIKPFKGKPMANWVYVGSREIIAHDVNESQLGHWILPGNLPSLLEGLSKAFGRSPHATVNSTFGWIYSWGGFSIHDNTPEVVGPTDPPYQWEVTVSHVGTVLVETVKHIHVGTSGSAAHAIADAEWLPGTYVAEILASPLTIPTTGSPVLWTEVHGGAAIPDPIVSMRGPVGSWLS